MEKRDRVPPHDDEIERAVLCSILLDQLENKTRGIYKEISPHDFYSRAHQRVFEAMLDLDKAAVTIEPLSLITALKKAGTLDEAGGENYVRSLYEAVPSNANAEYYAKILLDHSDRRSLLHIARDLGVMAYDESIGVQCIVNKALASLSEIKINRLG